MARSCTGVPDSPILMSILMSPTTRFEDDIGEETPFIPNDDPVPCKPTPLPTAQISILLSLWVAEAVVEHSITPYINQVRYWLRCLCYPC
jgi:hypothetical protein